jgi:hypothetical protein
LKPWWILGRLAGCVVLRAVGQTVNAKTALQPAAWGCIILFVDRGYIGEFVQTGRGPDSFAMNSANKGRTF